VFQTVVEEERLAMTEQSSTHPTAGEQVVNALKLVANVTVLPGTSQLVEGKVQEGMMYGLAGVASKVLSPLLGPLWWVPWVGLGLDSFSKSSSGRHLWQLSPTKPQPPVSTGPSIIAS
jgi:hypothetical protein